MSHATNAGPEPEPTGSPRGADCFIADVAAPRAEKSAYSVRIAATTQEVEELRPVWEAWTTCLYTDIDFYLQSLRDDRTILRPYVVNVWKGGEPVAILAGQVRSRIAFTIVAKVRIQGPRVAVLEIATKGRLGPSSPEVDDVIVAQLSKALKEDDFDLLCFERLPIESQLFRKIWNVAGMGIRKRVPHVFSYSELSLIAPLGEKPAVFSGKIMREARRKTANLERAFPGRVRLRCFSRTMEFDEGLRDAVQVRVATWQHLLDSGFTEALPTLENIRFCVNKGWMRIYVLYVMDRPCAFLMGQLHGKTFFCQHAGYDAEFEKLSVGSVLTTWAFEDLAEAGAERVDLGEGGQEHNRRLGCEKIDEGTVHVYAPTLRGLYLSLFFGAAQTSRYIGRKVRTKLHLDWAAKLWGERLAERRAKLHQGEAIQQQWGDSLQRMS